ncbi:hypothetical protein M422DRAFT_243908 [Sphaerobolus stellatus SS14]|nr:hypothetical protein M422DRAFT_243908 [Sphaerobolus stellatus SS14]
MGLDSGSGQNLGDAPSEPEPVSPDPGDTEDEDFTIPAIEIRLLWWEYADFVNLKENTEIVVSEAMEATEWVNTVFTWIRTSMNSMSLRMKELFLVPSKKVSGNMCEPGNNWAHDKAAAKAATERIIDQTSMMEPAPGSGAEERVRTTWSHIPGDQYSQSHTVLNIQHPARSEQSDDSQLRCGCEVHTGYACATRDARVTNQPHTHYACDIHVTESTHVNSQESTHRRCDASPINTWHEPVSVNRCDRPSLSAEQVIQGVPESIECSWHSIREPQSIDMNVLREEIKDTISATIKEKLCSDADSVTTASAKT